MSIDELEAYVEKQIEERIAKGLPASEEEEDALRKKIRLKTSRQLREILDQLEIEYPYDASKAELQRITYESNAIDEYDKKFGKKRQKSKEPDPYDFDDEDFEPPKRPGGRRRPWDPPSPPPPRAPFVCNAERHGGDGGRAHPLTCAHALWKTGRKAPAECIRWAATNASACDADAERTPAKDLGCYSFVPAHAPGYCECAGGHVTARSGCDHEVFTCQQMCTRARAERRRSKAEMRAAAGFPFPPSPPPPPFVYAIGAFGVAGDGFVNSLGLICSDGSRTATAGTPPKFGQGFEFVCPGWKLCRDADEHCTDWAAAGECTKNPGYMLVNCMRSCSACPARVRDSDDALGIVGIDVRAGHLVDAVRFRCGNALGEISLNESAATRSDWFGGDGGDECYLDCEGTNHTDGYRGGGLVQSVVAASGQRVDRLELAKCSEDVEI